MAAKAITSTTTKLKKPEGCGKIEIRGIVKKYGQVLAVDDVSFVVQEGEVVGLLGPSGCGKTTILRSIAGLEEIDSGSILLDGKPVTSPKERIFVPPERRSLGLVFQSYALWPHMSVRDNVDYCLQGRGLARQERRERIRKTLELVGLAGLEDRYPSQLSGGQQQRVALARSLCYEPKVLLLDEPLSNLDMRVRERVRGELRSLLKKIGITTVFVSHDQEEAFVISDRVILLNRGKIIQQGAPDQLYTRPADQFVAEFIGRSNILNAVVESNPIDKSTAKIKIPEMKADLYCQSESEIPQNCSLVVIRYNEIGLGKSKPSFKENVIKGAIISKEYRGTVTDHKVQVGDAQLVVTTHRFCAISEDSSDETEVYLHIPPHAIKPLVKSVLGIVPR